jgi:hypothetical protein
MTPAALSHALEDMYPPAPVETTKSLVADVALRLVYDKTAAGSCKSLPQYREVFPTSSHRAVPFDPKYVEGDRQMYPAAKPGTSREPRRVTKQSALKLVAKALNATVGDKATPVKHIQKAADVDRSTAAAWLKGHNLLGAHHLLNLMIEWPEFAAEVRRIYTMERELHEDLTRDIADLIRRAMQR